VQGMDADNSGSITVDELKAGMKKAGSPVALAELQALLAHIDVDANGAYPSALPCGFCATNAKLQLASADQFCCTMFDPKSCWNVHDEGC